MSGSQKPGTRPFVNSQKPRNTWKAGHRQGPAARPESRLLRRRPLAGHHQREERRLLQGVDSQRGEKSFFRDVWCLRCVTVTTV
jgi:hypothetical protein